MSENYGRCVFYLVIKELAEVLHVHLALICINNSCECIELNLVGINVHNGFDNIAELAYSGGFYDYSFGRKVGDDLLESFAEVTYKRTTDAT